MKLLLAIVMYGLTWFVIGALSALMVFANTTGYLFFGSLAVLTCIANLIIVNEINKEVKVNGSK